MKKHSLEITAFDTLFFKDGKPFSMGEESWAMGIFPPYPSAIYGMLRSIWFAGDIPALAHANDPAHDPSIGLKINGYLPVLDGMPAFPIPADLFAIDAAPVARPLIFESCPSGLLSDYPFPCCLRAPVTEKYKALHGKSLLLLSNFETYLNATQREIPFENINDYTCEEPKVGIGKDRFTRTSADGQLYRIAMRRLSKKGADGNLKELRFRLAFEGLDLPTSGLTRFGAETKSASFETVDFPSIHPVQGPEASGRFKIYLATPAVFEEGAYPKQWFEKHGITLLAAAMGRVEHIGGFDIQARQPKPMQKAIPQALYITCRSKMQPKLKRCANSCIKVRFTTSATPTIRSQSPLPNKDLASLLLEIFTH